MAQYGWLAIAALLAALVALAGMDHPPSTPTNHPQQFEQYVIETENPSRLFDDFWEIAPDRDKHTTTKRALTIHEWCELVWTGAIIADECELPRPQPSSSPDAW